MRRDLEADYFNRLEERKVYLKLDYTEWCNKQSKRRFVIYKSRIFLEPN